MSGAMGLSLLGEGVKAGQKWVCFWPKLVFGHMIVMRTACRYDKETLAPTGMYPRLEENSAYYPKKAEP